MARFAYCSGTNKHSWNNIKFQRISINIKHNKKSIKLITIMYKYTFFFTGFKAKHKLAMQNSHGQLSSSKSSGFSPPVKEVPCKENSTGKYWAMLTNRCLKTFSEFFAGNFLVFCTTILLLE